jgi:hypothetical protein
MYRVLFRCQAISRDCLISLWAITLYIAPARLGGISPEANRFLGRTGRVAFSEAHGAQHDQSRASCSGSAGPERCGSGAATSAASGRRVRSGPGITATGRLP